MFQHLDTVFVRVSTPWVHFDVRSTLGTGPNFLSNSQGIVCRAKPFARACRDFHDSDGIRNLSCIFWVGEQSIRKSSCRYANEQKPPVWAFKKTKSAPNVSIISSRLLPLHNQNCKLSYSAKCH